MQSADRRLVTESAQAAALAAEATARNALSTRVSAVENLGGITPGNTSDAAVSALLAQSTTATRTGLDARYGHAVSAAADLAGLAAGADPTGRLQAAIDRAPDGARVVIPPGAYTLTGPLRVTGKSLVLEGYGVTLTAAGAHGVLSASGTYGPVLNVSAVAATTVTSSGAAVTATRITTDGAPSLSRGDVVKIVADDPIPGARPGTATESSRVGEFAVVDSVNGADIVVMGALRETYTTNVRVARLMPHAVHVRGITAAAAAPANSTATMLGFTALAGPTVEDVRVLSSGASGLIFLGCYGYTVQDVTIAHALNDTAGGHYGYGVLDNSSSFGRITGLVARHVRHAYSDDSMRIPVLSVLDRYGRTYGTRIVDGIAHGTSVTAWDTHGASEAVSFTNCQAHGCYQGFGLRGRRHTVRSGYVRGGGHGVFIFTEAEGSDSWGHTVEDVTVQDVTDTPVNIYLNGAGTTNAGVRETRPSRLHNLRLSTAPGSVNAGVRAQNAAVTVSDVEVTAGATVTEGARMFSFQNCAATITGARVDTTAPTAGALVLLNSSASTTLTVRDLALVNTAATAARTTAIGNTSADVVDVSGVVYDYRPASLIAAQNANVVHDYVSRLDTGYSSAGQIQGSPSFAFGLRFTRQDYAIGIVASGTNPTVSGLLAGRRNGQLLRLSNLGAVNLTVPNSTDAKILLTAGANLTVGPKRSLTLLWDGSNWIQADPL